MKLAARMLILVTSLILVFEWLPGQDQDLSGTWLGSTSIPGREERNNLTLVLKKEGASYAGTITDSMGMLNATVLEKVKFEKGTISFEFLATVNAATIRVRTTLNLSGDKLAGSWESEEGDTAALELVRKK